MTGLAPAAATKPLEGECLQLQQHVRDNTPRAQVWPEPGSFMAAGAALLSQGTATAPPQQWRSCSSLHYRQARQEGSVGRTRYAQARTRASLDWGHLITQLRVGVQGGGTLRLGLWLLSDIHTWLGSSGS